MCVARLGWPLLGGSRSIRVPAGALVAAALFFGAASVWAAQEAARPAEDSEAYRLASEYVTRFADKAKRDAQREFAQGDKPVSPESIEQVLPGYGKLDDQRRDRLDQAAIAELKKLEDALKNSNETSSNELAQLERDWTVIRARRCQAALDVSAASSRRAAMGVAFLFSLDNLWLWISGLIVGGIFAGVVWHDNRRELRRYGHGFRDQHVGLSLVLGLCLVLLLLATLVTFFFGEDVYRLLAASGQDDQTSALDAIQQELDSLKAEEKASLSKATPSQPMEPSSSKADDSRDAELSQPWNRMRIELQTARVTLKAIEKMAAAKEQDRQELNKLTKDFASHQSAIASFRSLRRYVCLGTGCSLILLTCAGAVVFARRVKRRKLEVAKVCPMCLAEDTLRRDEHSSFGDLESVTCSNVIDGDRYQECGFSFLSIYRPLEKLYIPTLGHPSSGKTLWSAMVYRELIRGNYDESIQFQKIRSKSAEDFDRLVEDLIIDRVGPAATQVAELPHPLIFDFRDRDRWGKSRVLVSIFDYSGEVMERMSLEAPQRRRALVADAYLVFCDPMQAADLQARELVNFAADVQALRQATRGRGSRGVGRRHTPVALCMPKIDLLVNVEAFQSGEASGDVQRFYEELDEIDARYPAMSLARIRARSDLVARIRDAIWPGWKIEAQIRSTFGGRFMFFPLTPVGLGELGQADLRDRVLQPYAILEPLLWLLHMNGYPVLH